LRAFRPENQELPKTEQLLNPDEFRAAVLSHFAAPPEAMSCERLAQVLDGTLFRQSQIVSEFLDQVRLIGERLAGSPPSDPDLLSLMKDLLVKILIHHQQSVLGLPQAVIQTASVQKGA
jgi:hypothetical protein